MAGRRVMRWKDCGRSCGCSQRLHLPAAKIRGDLRVVEAKRLRVRANRQESEEEQRKKLFHCCLTSLLLPQVLTPNVGASPLIGYPAGAATAARRSTLVLSPAVDGLLGRRSSTAARFRKRLKDSSIVIVGGVSGGWEVVSPQYIPYRLFRGSGRWKR